MRHFLLVCIIWAFSCMITLAQNDTLYVSDSQTIHLRFDSELLYVNLGDNILVARIADNSKEFLAIKAKEKFDFTTSVFCIESDGDIHSFPVKFAENPVRQLVDTRAELPESDISGTIPPEVSLHERKVSPMFAPTESDAFGEIKKELYHIGCNGYGMTITCDNIFYRNDKLYLVMQLTNDSSVSYKLTEPRFTVESRKKSKRNLEYEKNLIPRKIFGKGIVLPGESVRLTASLDKITLLKSQILRIYFYEDNGTRNFILTIGTNDVNKARRL